jgi:hypothetical protein
MRVIVLAAVLGATGLLAGCYQGVGAGNGVMYRVNRITGAVTFCTGTKCWTTTTEEESKDKPQAN